MEPWAEGLEPLVAAWVVERFGEPTEPQLQGWPAIARGGDVLLSAPTGTGKTLAAFLTAISQLLRQSLQGRLRPETAVVYVSPLKALANDIEINLQEPLAAIQRHALEAGHLGEEIRTAVRTGDTPAAERAAMLRRPPHILVTTPESLYLLLTSSKGRALLRTTRSVVVDEIHALAGNKRGAHLALSLERLDALAAAGGRRPQRIGLSATVRPMAEVASFLAGPNRPIQTIAVPRRRLMDVAVETPQASALGPVATNEQWEERADRLAELAQQHRATLVFVSTRSLAERLAHRLESRLGADAVAAHHGSLSRKIRLRAEQRFKQGQLRALVATASLELGLDIGHVDLVCQIGSPRSFSVAWQRIGRAGHHRGAVSKGRFFALTRDDLIECAALARALRRRPPGSAAEDAAPDEIDALTIPAWPRDILAQQIVATVAADSMRADDLFDLARRAYPYRDLPRAEFDAVVQVLAAGISERRGRGGAWLHRYSLPGPDGPEVWLRARRGARLAALTSGGAIAEQAAYAVVAQPENLPVGSLDEDFAIEAHAADIILLGTTSWRILGIETGRVRVENAHGAPPTVPFWKGEALGRTPELSAAAAGLRREIAARPGEDCAWLEQECGLGPQGARQAQDYVRAGAAELSGTPAATEIIAERFFDEGGGMQLVIHAPFGSRINRAWGMALRKRFCRGFDFELQAAAGENGLLLSLSEQHSFPLETIFEFLHSRTAEEILVQAVLQAPLFPTRWRWTVGRALAMLRFSGGRKTPPQIQRMRAEDLLAAAFPRALGCQDNHGGDLEVPDHPYVREALRDCLHEALDLDGWLAVLRGLESGGIRFRALDRPAPSVFAAEMVNSAPHTYLDDAPLEERRARAVQLRRDGAFAVSAALDPAAVEAVRREAWPGPEGAEELHDVLLSLRWLPRAKTPEDWLGWMQALELTGRVQAGQLGPQAGWRVDEAVAHPDAVLAAGAVRGWMEIAGPVSVPDLAAQLGLPTQAVADALLALEADGQVLRGCFTGPPDCPEEWCDRRLLARIHRRTLHRLRAEIEPVDPDVWRRFLARWQHAEPETRLSGAAGLSVVLRQLQGWEAAAEDWERAILPARVRDYDPADLDLLCLSGELGWGRLWPPAAAPTGARRRRRPARNAPMAFFRREDAGWLLPPSSDARRFSTAAEAVVGWLSHRGALFFADLARLAAAGEGGGEKLVASQVEDALWELAAVGQVTADGFDNLRALLDPKRRRGEGHGRAARPRHSAGRWSLLSRPAMPLPARGTPEEAALAERLLEQLLRRYGVLFRAAVERERLLVGWYALLQAARRWEARGLARGGHFVRGFSGEQFALPEAVEALRAARRLPSVPRWTPAPTDPLAAEGEAVANLQAMVV
ncbi:MAG: DEAD/DEAH box helicase [Terriglobales bacterium]